MTRRLRINALRQLHTVEGRDPTAAQKSADGHEKAQRDDDKPT